MLHPLDAALKIHGDDENLVVARRNCGRLLRLVNQLLDFQKLSVETQTLELEPVDAVSFLRVASDYFASSSAHRSLSFSVTIDGEPISTTERQVGVVGELDALEKVIFNYLSNAMKFSPDEGEIELGIVVDPTLVRFFVRDTGPGIREEDKSKLFQIFSQLDDSSTRAYEGTGLGLALCKTLAMQMDGKVGVDTVVGEERPFGSNSSVPMCRWIRQVRRSVPRIGSWTGPIIYHRLVASSREPTAMRMYWWSMTSAICEI